VPSHPDTLCYCLTDPTGRYWWSRSGGLHPLGARPPTMYHDYQSALRAARALAAALRLTVRLVPCRLRHLA